MTAHTHRTERVSALTLDPVVREWAAATAGLADSVVNSAAARAAFSECARYRGVAASTLNELMDAVNAVRIEMQPTDEFTGLRQAPRMQQTPETL